MIIAIPEKYSPELDIQITFDTYGLGFNHDTLVVEFLREELGMETEELEVV